MNTLIHIVDWVDIDAFNIRPNRYEISRYGDVRLKDTGRILKSYRLEAKSAFYERIRLCTTDGKMHQFFIHRLVAYHFCGTPKHPELLQVNHIDGKTLNNVWWNLEWVTGSENMIHAYKYGLSTTKGENCHMCKYSDITVHAICELLQQGYRPKGIIRELNLLDLTKYNYMSKEYSRVRSYIKKLRTKTFRKDITLKYKF